MVYVQAQYLTKNLCHKSKQDWERACFLFI
jgi:hypothetical protein